MNTNPHIPTTKLAEIREMPAHLQQYVFARLLVDEQWRRHIQNNQCILEIIDPNPQEKTAPRKYLCQYSDKEWDDICVAADNLIDKRRGHVAEVSPVLREKIRAVDTEMWPILFRAHAVLCLIDGVHKHRADACAFAERLSDPAWITEICQKSQKTGDYRSVVTTACEVVAWLSSGFWRREKIHPLCHLPIVSMSKVPLTLRVHPSRGVILAAGVRRWHMLRR